MVLSIIIAVIAAPGLLGSQEAIRQSQAKEKKEEHRARRCNLIATCIRSSLSSREIDGRPVVLRNGKLWIDTGTKDGGPFGHLYAGYFLPYPDSKHEGLVTTITNIAPIMNWVYVDKDTLEIKYGVRADAQPNLTGPFDCTRQDRRLTFDGWEGWCAVEESPGLWALYFDIDDDGLKSKVAPGTRVLEVELSRKETRFKKEPGARLQDQTTKRSIQAQEEAPVDEPLATEAPMQHPGAFDDPPSMNTVQPKPFAIPKSIFNDEKPLDIPKTIFKDWSRTAQPVSPRPVTPKMQSAESSTTLTSGEPLRSPISMTADATLQKSSLILSPAQSNRESASLTVPLRTTPGSEKRTTPTLNRSSGTRALTQAQMFEAMISAKDSSPIMRPRNRSSVSPHSSSTDPRSTKLNESDIFADKFGANTRNLPDNALPGAPEGSAVSKGKEPIPDSQESTTLSPDLKADTYVQQPKAPKTQRPPISVKNPVASGAILPGKSASSPRSQRPNVSKPPPTSRYPSAQYSPRNPSDLSNGSRGRRVVRDNQLFLSGAGPTRSTSSSTPQMNKASTPRSLAATMTTGQSNRGMASRISESGNQYSPTPGRLTVSRNDGGPSTTKKTMSALFREIDDMVSQDVSNRIDSNAGDNLRSSETMPRPRQRGNSSESSLKDPDGRIIRSRTVKDGGIQRDKQTGRVIRR